jgi:L-2-hydroxyglutarate oxidase LhgO
MDFDIIVIGAGVVGLSIASYSADRKKNILVIEKYSSFGQETSSRSSEVIHAGIYYRKGSLKAELCVMGNEMLYALAKKHSIPFKNSGKLIVAVNEKEKGRLPSILKNAAEIGAKDLRLVEKKEISKLEPNVEALAALYCPTSGMIDSHSLMKHFYLSAKDNGADFLFGGEVIGVQKKNGHYEITVREAGGTASKVTAGVVVNSAGLFSGKVAEMAGFDVDKLKYRIFYRKGEYFRVQKKLAEMPKMLIYPVPPEDSTVGIHTVPELSGGMRLGPRDSWTEHLDYSVDETLLDEIYDATKPFLPVLEKEDITPDMAGFQAKRFGPGENSRDFIIQEESGNGFPGFINLVGIESPGLTSSPAIGMKVRSIIDGCM